MISVRVYRDSIRNDSGLYVPLEARVVDDKIISVYVDSREIGPEDYDMYAGPLLEMLQREKELKDKLAVVSEEIRIREKERDSLEEAPLVVDSLLFYPGPDMQEQVLAVLEEKTEEAATPEDTLSREPLLPDGEKINEMMQLLTQRKAQRDEILEQIKGELTRLEAERSKIRDELDVIADAFTLEKETVHASGKPKKKEKHAGKKGKRNKRKR